MDQLEDQMGAKLFIRTSSGVDLTPAGRRVMEIAESIEMLTHGLGMEALAEAQFVGTIRFKGSDGIGGYWLPMVLADFHAKYPNITVESVCTAYHETPDLSRREADITVVYQEPTDPDVCIISEGMLVYRPMASVAYAEQHGLPTTFEGLLDHPFVAHESYFAQSEPWTRLADLLRRHPRIAFRSNSSLAVGQAVRRGHGITYMPIGIDEPDAMFFDIDGWTPSRPFWMVCHRGVKNLPPVRAFIDHLKHSLFRGRAMTTVHVTTSDDDNEG